MRILTRGEQISNRKDLLINLMEYQEKIIRRIDCQIENANRSFFAGSDVCRLVDEKEKANLILEVLEEYLKDLPA